MKRSFHVVYKPNGGTRQDESITSYDTYEIAKGIAQAFYNRMGEGDQIEITNAGLIVWGPFVKGVLV